ncbi:V-type ATPase subunit [Candidatus Fermentibacteria bacterium]|nr:V-type ATPase subunit [Candidatus Fermentibacteria bacterium]
MTPSLLWIPPDDLRYAHGVSLVRAMEWTLLSRKTLDAMARADDAAEALEELSETHYASFMTPGQHVADFELILSRALESAYLLFRRLVLDPDLEQGALRLHDFHNLKAMLKANLEGSEPVGIVPFGLVDARCIRDAVEGRDYQGLPLDLAAVARQALGSYQISRDPRLLEVIIDTAAVAARVSSFAGLNTQVLPDYAVLLADTTNIRTVVRMGRSNQDPSLFDLACIPGGSLPVDSLRLSLGKRATLGEVYSMTPYAKAVREGLAYLQEKNSYAVLDRELENLLIGTLRETRFVFFSPAPIVAFLLAREHEVRMIRLVMVAKINRIPAELIAARLPMLYA